MMYPSRQQRRELTEIEMRVYRILRVAASYSTVAPTNAQIAERVGYFHGEHGSGPIADVVSAIEAAGYIRVWRFAVSRVVEIIDTHQRTAAAGHTAPHWTIQLRGTATYSDFRCASNST